MPPRKPVRAPHETLYVRLAPADAARARAQAAHAGKSMGDYIAARIRDDALLPMPPSQARLGGCILDAIAALEQPAPDTAAAIASLREAQRLGAEFARAYLPAFDEMHALDDPERTTDGDR